MIRIDKQLLEEIGLGALSDIDKKALIDQIIETLELRVGKKLADQMSNEQLEEFESYYNAKDEKGAFNWLETNFPNYKELVQTEFDALKSEIIQSIPQILQASGVNNQANPNVMPNVNPVNPPNPIQPNPNPNDQLGGPAPKL